MAASVDYGNGTPGSVPCSKVELSLSCSNLPNMDILSKSDPMCVLYTKPNKREWVKYGMTEMISDNLNPKFAKTFTLDYYFEEVQPLKVEVYDVDNVQNIASLRLHDFIGQVELTLAEIVSAGQQLTRSLRREHKTGTRGKIHFMAEELQDNKFDIRFDLSASKLEKKDLFGKSDPYLEIAKAQEGGAYTLAYRSEVIKRNLNPRWKGFTLPIQKLCGGDWDRTLKFTVYDWNSSGTPDFIGMTTISLRDICRERGGTVRNLPLVNPEKQARKKGKYVNSGLLNFEVVRATPTYTFVDYIRGGSQINLVVAVDFTASNGKPSDSKSLHHMAPNYENEYIYAIKSVGSVLAPYDSDQQYPCFGFGARLPPYQQVSHCFALNGNEQNAEVAGIDGILGAYQYAISQVQLYGPTNFSSFLDRVISMASQPTTQQNQAYYILLVITDGIITDMQNTVDRIVRASSLPLSIVIVGVGGADFTNMEILDADETPLVDRQGRRMQRDIVQFVPLRQFRSQRNPDNFSLARETLAEIPGQLLSFMKSRNIHPNKPVLQRRDTGMSIASQQAYDQNPATAPPPYPTGFPPQTRSSMIQSGPYPVSAAPYPTATPGIPPYPL